MRRLRAVLALVAAVFGIATLVAGARVLAGADPGYVVFRPLLLYNTAMGAAYLAAAAIAWRSARHGPRAAAAIFALNAAVLAAIAWLRANGDDVARESVGAMTFRTVVWLVILLGLVWARRAERP